GPRGGAAEPALTSEPGVLLVRADPVDAEQHPETAAVDASVCAGRLGERVEGGDGEERDASSRSTVSPRSCPLGTDEPKWCARERGESLRPRPEDEPAGDRAAEEIRRHRFAECDLA